VFTIGTGCFLGRSRRRGAALVVMKLKILILLYHLGEAEKLDEALSTISLEEYHLKSITINLRKLGLP
jgi:hypothetical protein